MTTTSSTPRPGRRWRRALLAGLFAAAVTATIAGAGATYAGADRAAPEGTAAESPSGARCRGHYFRVRVGTPQPTEHKLYGELCVRGRLTSRTPVQVLLHGGTYDHRYWDWPYQARRYSYVSHATRAGFATVNLDRLGYGRSSHPDPSTVDFEVGADAVRQVVAQLRAGALGPRVRTIVLNGHSMGGMVAERAAAHGGVDAVIISGLPPERPGDDDSDQDDDGPGGPGDGLYPFYPAEQDPKFADKPWAPGYLTTLPGTRDEAFLYPGTYDPAILRWEEALKDTLTIAEIRAVRPPEDGARQAGTPGPVTVPIAYAVGSNDTIACPSRDCPTDPAAGAADHITPRSGHSINTSLGATLFYRWTFDWLARNGIRPGR